MKSALGDVLNDAVVIYDVPLWLDDNEGIAHIRQLDEGINETITRILWTPRHMALCAWCFKGEGLLVFVGTVLCGQDTDACMYLIGNGQ